MTIFFETTIKNYSGLSSETKPTAAGGVTVPNGSRWREVDTQRKYHYNLANDVWYEKKDRVIVTNKYLQDVAEGKHPGRSLVFVFGQNPQVGTAYADHWDNRGLISVPALETWEALSSSANDTLLGTGARKIAIGFLDSNYDQQVIEEIEMDGETPVVFSTSNQFIFQAAVVLDAGSSNANEGFITIRKAGGSSPDNDRGGISIGRNLSAYGSYVVPAGHTAYVYRATSNINKNEDIETQVLVNVPEVNPNLFFRTNEISIYQSTFSEEYMPAVLAEKVWLRPQAKSSDVIAIATVFIQMMLVQDGF